MAILWLMERRAAAAVLMGVPLLLSILANELVEFAANYGLVQPTLEEVLEDEMRLLANGTLEETALPVPVLVWWTPFSVEHSRVRECGASSCLISRDRKLIEHPATKAVFFYGSDVNIEDLPPRKDGQDWALLHEESPKNKAVLNFGPALRLFNHTSTFRSASDLPLGTMHLHSLDSLINDRYLVMPEEKRSLQESDGLAPVVYIQSSCDCPSRRDDLVKRLGRHIPIDSYGACLNNKSMPNEVMKNRAVSPEESLLKLMAKYKFVLAMENARCPDYVTEKLWNALRVGSVPVYWGAPNVVEDFLPRGAASAVLVSDSKSAKDLAAKLKRLDEDDLAYKKMLAHKRRYAPTDGKPITNKKLVKAMNGRKWGSSKKDQLERGSFVEHFECLVCQRLTERTKLAKAGFGQAEPFQAGSDHYGCPIPTGALSDWEEESLTKEEQNGLRFWQEEHVDGFVKSVYLSVKMERGEEVTDSGLKRLFAQPKVAAVIDGIVEKGGDKSLLDVYEKELRNLILEENL